MECFIFKVYGSRSFAAIHNSENTFANANEAFSLGVVKMRCLWVRRKEREKGEEKGGEEKRRGGKGKKASLLFIRIFSTMVLFVTIIVLYVG